MQVNSARHDTEGVAHAHARTIGRALCVWASTAVSEHATLGQRAGQLVLGGQHAPGRVAENVRPAWGSVHPCARLSPTRPPRQPSMGRTARNRQALVRVKYEQKEWAAKTPINATPPTRGSTAAALLAASGEAAPAPTEVSVPVRVPPHLAFQPWIGRSWRCGGAMLTQEPCGHLGVSRNSQAKKKKKKKALGEDTTGADAAGGDDAGSLFAGLATVDSGATAAPAGVKAAAVSSIPRLPSSDGTSDTAATAAVPRARSRPVPAGSSATPAAAPARLPTGGRPTPPVATSAHASVPSSAPEAALAPGRDMKALEDLFHGMEVYADDASAPPAPTPARAVRPGLAANPASSSADDLLSLDFGAGGPAAGATTGATARPAAAGPAKAPLSASAILSLYGSTTGARPAA